MIVTDHVPNHHNLLRPRIIEDTVCISGIVEDKTHKKRNVVIADDHKEHRNCSITFQQKHLVLCEIKVYSELQTSFSHLRSLHLCNRMSAPQRRL